MGNDTIALLRRLVDAQRETLRDLNRWLAETKGREARLTEALRAVLKEYELLLERDGKARQEIAVLPEVAASHALLEGTDGKPASTHACSSSTEGPVVAESGAC